MHEIVREAIASECNPQLSTPAGTLWNTRPGEPSRPDWRSATYQGQLQAIYRELIMPGQHVLEVGCGPGDLLAAVQPDVGIGVDRAEEMVRLASRRHPSLDFMVADAHQLSLEQRFDTIILSDLVGEVWDVEQVFRQLQAVAHPHTRLLINFSNPRWRPWWRIACRPGGAPGFPLSVQEVVHFLHLANFEVVRTWNEILCPLSLPIWTTCANRVLARLEPFQSVASTHFVLARPAPLRPRMAEQPKVSVIVPARNEAGNIAAVFDRLPRMGSETELVFVEGHSQDDTYACVERQMALHPQRPCQLLRQVGIGKGDAVRLGFERARGDVLMILDADLTVAPEDLPRFYEALVAGKGDFINGVRLVYPMEPEAMRPLNRLGNRFFSRAVSWLTGQTVQDTLCGTKVLWKRDYLRLAARRADLGKLDPFGDFDLLFGAARLGLKILDLPIRYRARTYGATNIRRFQDGWQLLRMTARAARRLKFFPVRF